MRPNPNPLRRSPSGLIPGAALALALRRRADREREARAAADAEGASPERFESRARRMLEIAARSYCNPAARAHAEREAALALEKARALRSPRARLGRALRRVARRLGNAGLRARFGRRALRGAFRATMRAARFAEGAPQ